MPVGWRWDQGRLQYLLFENLRRITKILVQHNGETLRGGDPLRRPLEAGTSLPFSPRNYTVWRNYKRVFGEAMVATEIDGRLVVTDVGNFVARETCTADEYFAVIIPRFCFPSPVFDAWRPRDNRVYPLCALLKFLVTRPVRNPSITVDNVFAFLIGNGVDGSEGRSDYVNMRATRHRPGGDEARQVREMLIFLSQVSWLKWSRQRLVLDCDVDVAGEQILDLAQPVIRPVESHRHQEMIRMCSLPGAPRIVEIMTPPEGAEEEVVIPEGLKKPICAWLKREFPSLRPEDLDDLWGDSLVEIIESTNNGTFDSKTKDELHNADSTLDALIAYLFNLPPEFDDSLPTAEEQDRILSPEDIAAISKDTLSRVLDGTKPDSSSNHMREDKHEEADRH